MVTTTYSGLGGSLASNVPSLRRSFDSSGSLSVSELSIGSSGFIMAPDCCWDFADDGGCCCRVFRGAASFGGCGC